MSRRRIFTSSFKIFVCKIKENKGEKVKMLKHTEDYILSTEVDRWLFHADILVDKAHVVMLKEQGIIKKDAAAAILNCLTSLEERSADFIEDELPGYEDVHTAIESVVIQEIGEDVGGRMHTGRSRNDEVATCIRIALRTELFELLRAVNGLRRALLEKAGEHLDTIMPGYTHLQHAQATTFAHHLLAYTDALARDFSRLIIAYEHTNVSPLGAAAFASTGFPIDRDRTASLLGFDAVLEHSMDAVSTRDFIIEAIASFSNLMINISRLAEEFILWSTSEFDFITIDADYVTGSSIMPQKRNPDYAELVRARTGTVYGCLMSGLSICKALPYSYNRDLQEVTPHLLRAVRTTTASVTVMKGMVEGLEAKLEKMEKQAPVGFTAATELADTIVRETCISFRTAHKIVSALASSLRDEDWDWDRDWDSQRIDELTLKITGTGQKLSDTATGRELNLNEKSVKEALKIASNIQKRNAKGGPAKKEVKRMMQQREKNLATDEKTRLEKEEYVKKSFDLLEREVQRKKRIVKLIKMNR